MKGVKCFIPYRKLFIILALLFVPFFILFANTNDTHASGNISQILAAQAQYTKNFDDTIIYNTIGTTSLPAYVVGDNSPSGLTGFWYYSQNFVFSNPSSQKSGTGFSHTVYFTLTSTMGDFANDDYGSMLVSSDLTFEGIDTHKPYCTIGTTNIVFRTPNSVRFKISSNCPAGTYTSNQSFNNVLVKVNYRVNEHYNNSLFWCANDNSDPARHCPSNYFGIVLSDVDYSFALSQNSSEGLTQTIINQNQQIIDQNNQDREDLQNQSGTSSSDASSAASSVTSGFSSLTSVIGGFVDIILHPPSSNCVIDADMGHMDLGDIDLCQLDPPPAIQVIATLLFIGFTIPFAYSLIMFLLNLLGDITEGS